MARIQIGGAGGAPSNNVILALRESDRSDHLIGTSSVATDLFLADVDEKHIVLPAVHPEYPEHILRLLGTTKPHFLHLQHDFEVRAISRMRAQIEDLGIKLYLPSERTIEDCVNKYRSNVIWTAAGVRVPKTILLCDANDLGRAFRDLGPTVWIRAVEGGGGQGALPTSDPEMAKIWIGAFNGWGRFSASQLLTPDSVTWLSLWHEGELVVAQARKRWRWSFGDRNLSGVTGITAVGETIRDETVDRVAQDAILAIDARPHGIFGVDMTYDLDGWPNPTEINIGRFFTTVLFFARAGLNLPAIYCDIALEGRFPTLERRINPLPPGLLWIRGMDVGPVLTDVKSFDEARKAWTA